jgi:outer membrane protein
MRSLWQSENNFDIAIARYDLDIADTDILRTRTGATPLGAPSGLVTALWAALLPR